MANATPMFGSDITEYDSSEYELELPFKWEPVDNDELLDIVKNSDKDADLQFAKDKINWFKKAKKEYCLIMSGCCVLTDPFESELLKISVADIYMLKGKLVALSGRHVARFSKQDLMDAALKAYKIVKDYREFAISRGRIKDKS
jgi:hypothetical protein